MKIAYFGYDPLFSCLEVFLKQGHDFAMIYTGESSQFSNNVIQFAQRNDIPLCFGQPTLTEMKNLLGLGVELFFSAEYPWKIPIPAGLKYAINVHPTLLPEGRGMTPLPQLILKQSIYAGITLHKLSNQFDAGDILLQKAVLLDEDETFDSLSAKIFKQTPELLFTLLSDFDDYYRNSQAQGEGSDWASITADEQTLDWRQPTAALLTTLRAFGSLGTYADIAGKACVIIYSSASSAFLNSKSYPFSQQSQSTLAVNGKCYQHNYSAGQVIRNNELHITIATFNGELCIPNQSILWKLLDKKPLT
jgi:methionyl-tRNA formyltransferase